MTGKADTRRQRQGEEWRAGMRDYEEGEILTSIYSAQGVDRSRITISGPIPAFNDLGELRRQFESDAERLADHLQARLPGGTLDALLRHLLERKALMLVVPLGD